MTEIEKRWELDKEWYRAGIDMSRRRNSFVQISYGDMGEWQERDNGALKVFGYWVGNQDAKQFVKTGVGSTWAEALEQALTFVEGGEVKSFKDIALALGDLVTEKNAAYGDATKTGAEAMRKLFPNGVKPEQYEDFGYCLLVWHKLSRVATNPNAFGENPKQDIAGYSILALTREQVTDGPKERPPLGPNPFVCSKCGLDMENFTQPSNGLNWQKVCCWPCWQKQYSDLDTKCLGLWRNSANEREIKEVEALLNPDREIELLARKLSISSKVCKACEGWREEHTCIYGSPA